MATKQTFLRMANATVHYTTAARRPGKIVAIYNGNMNIIPNCNLTFAALNEIYHYIHTYSEG